MALGSGSGSGLGSATRTPSKGKPSIFGQVLHGVGAVTTKPMGNLLGDVKDAVVGLPMGLVQTVQHPIRTGEQMVGMTWHTWSPLFKGDFVKFGKQVYDHPLAPILDVVSVLSLGVGAAAKGANVAAGAAGTARIAAKIAANEPLVGATEKLASLKMGKKVTLQDPKGQLLDVDKYLSRRPMRRAMQEGLLSLDNAGHLPQFYVKARYNRLHLVDMAHKSIAKTETHASGLQKAADIESGTHPVQLGADPGFDAVYSTVASQTHAAIEGARAMEDTGFVGKRARRSLAAHMFTNIARHNKAYPEERAIALAGSRSSHNAYLLDPAFADPVHARAVLRATRRHSRASRRLSNHLVHAIPKRERWEASLKEAQARHQGMARTEADIERINAELARMSEAGHVVSGGARRLDGSNRLITNPSKKQLANYETQRMQDLHVQLKDLNAKRESARQAGVKATLIEKRLTTLDNQEALLRGMVEERHGDLNATADRAVEDYFNWAGDSHDSIKNFVGNFGKIATTHNLAHALRDTDGKVFVAAKHDAYSLGIEGEGSLHFLHEILHKPTQVWKSITIGYTPRTITNNGVGNWFMYMVATGGPRGSRAFTDALRYQFGKDVVGDSLFARNHWVDRHFQDELGDQFGIGNEIVKRGVDDVNDAKFSGQWWKTQARQGLYPIVQKTSERPVRIASLYHTMRGFPEVQAEIARLRKAGVKGQPAVDRGIEAALKKHPDLRGEAALQSRRLAGDYVTMSGSEKWARDLVPFYLWNRHILKHTGNMFLEHPGRVATGAKLGMLGADATEEMVGELPDFLKGAIPLAALGFGDRTGRMNLLSTASLNPYATVGELAESVAAWTTGGVGRRGAALSQANPFVVGAAESVFQTSALTGVPSPRSGGVFEDVIGRTMAQFPYVKAAKVFTDGDRFKTPKGNDLLFGQTKTTAISSLLGVPIKDTSRARSEQLVKQQNGVKKTKGGLGS